MANSIRNYPDLLYNLRFLEFRNRSYFLIVLCPVTPLLLRGCQGSYGRSPIALLIVEIVLVATLKYPPIGVSVRTICTYVRTLATVLIR